MELKLRRKEARRKQAALKKEETFGPWIVSYADTVTLLLCFFVIFYAEQKKTTDISALIEIQEDLSQQFSKNSSSSENAVEKNVESSEKVLNTEDLKKLEFVNKEKKKEILIRMYAKDFFKVGGYHLKPDGKKVIEKLAKIFSPHKDKIFIQVEGHSDSLKVAKTAFYKSNLGLSSLRASEAAQIFLNEGVEESHIRVLGFGSSKPLVQDRGPSSEGAKYLPEVASKNRRIELRITTDFLDLDKIMNYK